MPDASTSFYTKACSGGRGGEHYVPENKCDGIYHCTDRSDEAGCNRTLHATVFRETETFDPLTQGHCV